MTKTQPKEYVACSIPRPEPPGPRIAVILHSELEAVFLDDLTQALKSGRYVPRVLTPSDLDNSNRRSVALAGEIKPARLLVVDDQVGGRSAFEYIHNLRFYEEFEETPICLLTSHNPDVFARNAWLAAGVDRIVYQSNQREISRFAKPLRVWRKDGWRIVTEDGREMVRLTQLEAIRLGENQVSTEHLLLALVHDDLSAEHPIAAVRILKEQFGLTPNRIRDATEERVQPGPGRDESQLMKLSPGSQRVFQMAADEAWMLGDDTIDTEHLLLGMVRDGSGLAGRVLASLGVDLESVRTFVSPVAG